MTVGLSLGVQMCSMLDRGSRRQRWFFVSLVGCAVLVAIEIVRHGFGPLQWFGIVFVGTSGLALFWFRSKGRPLTIARGAIVRFAGPVEVSPPEMSRALLTIAKNVAHPDANTWTASTRFSWRTFGDRLAITIRVVGAETEVAVLSWTSMQFVDYGKNRANVRRLVGALQLPATSNGWMGQRSLATSTAWDRRRREMRGKRHLVRRRLRTVGRRGEIAPDRQSGAGSLSVYRREPMRHAW